GNPPPISAPDAGEAPMEGKGGRPELSDCGKVDEADEDGKGGKPPLSVEAPGKGGRLEAEGVCEGKGGKADGFAAPLLARVKGGGATGEEEAWRFKVGAGGAFFLPAIRVWYPAGKIHWFSGRRRRTSSGTFLTIKFSEGSTVNSTKSKADV